MIPKRFTEKHLEKAKGSTFFGVPIEDLTKDELTACAVAGWEAQEAETKEASRQRKFLFSLITKR